MFRASLCPSSGEKYRVLLHMVLCTGCAGWLAVVVWSCVVSIVHCVKVTVRQVDISLVSLSSHYLHDARSQEPKTTIHVRHVSNLTF